jgi:ABC-type lipopolysaccharide export system ATPase subunit
MASPAAIRSVTAMTKYPSGIIPDEAVVASDLRMRYGEREVLTGLSFQVSRGELFALLGPNGAGKTSTVEILEGYRRRTGGQVRVLGTDPWQAGPGWHARIGVMLQEAGPEPDLTVAECLRLYGGYFPDPWPAGDLLEFTGLGQQSAQRATQLSGGQRRKLDPRTTWKKPSGLPTASRSSPPAPWSRRGRPRTASSPAKPPPPSPSPSRTA